MQKLELGVEYNQDDQTAELAPLTATSPLDSPTATPHYQVTRPRQPDSMSKSFSRLPLIIALLAIVGGGLTGLGAYNLQAKGGSLTGETNQPIKQVADANDIKNGDVFGSAETGFKDRAEGYLEIGGLDGEGSHKLIRPGGVSQTVYLVSTVTELDRFDGMNVKVWGETYKGQKAGWLMDVGRVQIINTKGENPSQE